MNTNRTRVQGEAIKLAKAGPYYRVRYNKDTGLPTGINPAIDRVHPSSVYCNEINSTFEVDSKYGRDYLLKKRTWVFELGLTFTEEVTFEMFEEALQQIPQYPRSGDLDQFRLVLRRIVYIHPITQEPAQGSQATVVLEAVLGRI